MDRAALERIEAQLAEHAREQFPGDALERVSVLQYGDDPMVEPGDLLVRVFIKGSGSREDRERALDAFHNEHRAAISEFRRTLDKAADVGMLEFRTSGDEGRGPDERGPRIMLGHPRRGALEAGALAGGEGQLTPVMARLGPVDLETLDTLITAGIAPSRAEAVRWALARIRERPAYAQLQQRAREIEELKTQF